MDRIRGFAGPIADSQKQLTTILSSETQTLGTVLFPDQTADDGRQFQFDEKRQWPTVTSNYAGIDYVQVRIVGVVDYRFSFNDYHHQTGFAFSLLDPTTTGPTPWFIRKDVTVVPKLDLMRSDVGNWAK